ncbi:MAG: glycosyltransferase family 4 protein [Alphaproteobacteria bacterium]|nr:glycosyltransferase family 4 protein [Alphaproteobacteria bacterium]
MSDKTKLFFYPNYSRANPFQTLLYDHFPRECEIEAGNIDAALRFQRDNPDYQVIFHLHWEDALYKIRKSGGAGFNFERYFELLNMFKDKGGAVVWTCHNMEPHENTQAALDESIKDKLSRTADLIVVHGDLVKKLFMEKHPDTPADTIYTMKLGTYGSCYDLTMSKETAREQLCLSADDIIFVHFGVIRPYKNIEALLEGFQVIADKHPRAKLIVAGQQGYHVKVKLRDDLALSRAIQDFERISDEQLALYLSASDCGVFPFRTVMVSSSVVTAMAFGLPCIVPERGALLELIQGGGNGIFMDSPADEKNAADKRKRGGSHGKIYRDVCCGQRKNEQESA